MKTNPIQSQFIRIEKALFYFNLGLTPINGNPQRPELYFSDYTPELARPGGHGELDIWQASVEPIVDLNGDGIVDAADMCIVVDHWGEDYSLCDIGPTPFGDGIVDVQDLIILAEHLFEEVADPNAVVDPNIVTP